MLFLIPSLHHPSTAVDAVSSSYSDIEQMHNTRIVSIVLLFVGG